ncbi:cyclopropane-fatty-acyl-phospholipid synthase family protein [Variovorax sp. J31P207]|uniref:SAM-dependent methyltransferase n=1 Tax=Variovorax sp. J31P207 TaxID=3053510 RepID=UPI0025773360|nr:cyclopropane-fatty-acyl-phospholipid synthase family protein [Variovorax sp. J31P207]MDM0068758.1 cyclopropane-fatty-acyl-phospholipid synthase family protein [Variovorax sp. J31P207]
MSAPSSSSHGFGGDDRAAGSGATGGGPLRQLLARLLGSLGQGALSVQLPDGQRIEGRGAADGPQASITLNRWRPLARLLLQGDLGLAASYRDGDWSTPDLAALLEFGIRNEASWGRVLEGSWFARRLGDLFRLRRANTRRGSRRNIAFHYDMGNDFYAQWLDPALIYSSALYARGDESLEAAQAAKIDRIVALLDLQPQSTVLEIGCGWGALATALASRHGARVTGLTLSTEQLAHARAQVRAQGLAQVDLRLQDYRDVEGRYDRIVSIEMLEAVGERYWPVYFDTLRERLAPGGSGVLQVITIADDHFERYRGSTDFVQRFIFPGGKLPSVRAMSAQAERAGLTLQTAESFGASYALTLAEWRRRFHAAWPAIAALGYDDAFRRLWEYYLCYCEAGFRSGRVDVGLFSFSHASKR